ncbi:hypothetical protein V6O07_19545, partial [Arthrospira platensis SPKY2]
MAGEKKKILFKKRKGLFNPDEKVPIALPNDILTMILSYVISTDPLITRGNLANARKLFNIIDDRLYDNDIYSEAKLHYIRQILIAKLDLYMDKKPLLLDFAHTNKYKEVIDDIMYDIDNCELGSPDIKYISSMI